MSTPGASKLRALRDERRRSQLWVETEADLGTGYLQRLESGRVAQPVRATLERILDALAARYDERCETLALFGYTASTPLPSDAELAWAREECRDELAAVIFPAYVLDCAHRLVAWNRYFPRLLGIGPGLPLPSGLMGRSILAPWFDPTSLLAPLVAEPERFLPALLRAFRFETGRFGGASWYRELVLDPLYELPRFRQYWAQIEAEPATAGAGRALVPVILDLPRGGRLQFRLASEPFTHDARFRAIYYFPADEDSMRQCVAWAEESSMQER